MSPGRHWSAGMNRPRISRRKIAHGVEVARNARRLRHVPAVAVENRRRIVEQLAHDGRSARAPDRYVHLGRRGGEGVVDDLKLDRRVWGRRSSSGPRCDEMAMGRGAAGPAGGNEHGGVDLLDDGRARRPGIGGDVGRGATPAPRASCRQSRPGAGQRRAPAVQRRSLGVLAAGRRPTAETRNDTISTGAPALA